MKTEKLDFFEEWFQIDAVLGKHRILSIVPVFGALVFDQDIIMTYDEDSPPMHDTSQFERHVRCFPMITRLNFFLEKIMEYCIMISKQFFVAKISGHKMVYIDYLQPKSLSGFLKQDYTNFHNALLSFIEAARLSFENGGDPESDAANVVDENVEEEFGEQTDEV